MSLLVLFCVLVTHIGQTGNVSSFLRGVLHLKQHRAAWLNDGNAGIALVVLMLFLKLNSIGWIVSV